MAERVGGTAAPAGQEEIDEHLQSRQMAVYGRESMRRLRHARVLIVGSDGLAAEIAKNVILANVGSVTLCDLGVVAKHSHLSSHFYLREEDIGKPVALASLQRLQELNDSVSVSVVEDIPVSDISASFTCVVCVGVTLKKCLPLSNACRACSPAIPFIRCSVRGLYGTVFNDFGPEFVVEDEDGRSLNTAVMTGVTERRGKLEIMCVVGEDHVLSFQAGQTVKFTEVRGMVELCQRDFKVFNSDKHRFMVMKKPGETFSAYTDGGIATQVKQPKTLKFKPLQEALKDPGEIKSLGGGHQLLLHLYNQALDDFEQNHGMLPQPSNAEHAEEVIKTVSALAENLPEDKRPTVDADLVRKLCSGASAVINPMAAIFGGIVGQEVVKASTGKYTPIHQWVHAHMLECLPSECLPKEEYQAQGSRYDDNIAVFGRQFQDALSHLKYFLVGCGALGCEFLKNFAMLGMGTAADGCITVTDDDIIERSNLSRQFLFRNRNVGQAKSVTAAASATDMNPAIHIKAMQDRVSPDTEMVFNAGFWNGLDGVCNALDNVKARHYVDEQCVHHSLTLLESGTLGTQSNVQVIIPHETEHYGARRDQPDKQVPQCVIHNFPSNIEHCLTFARSEFVGHFDTNPSEVNKFIDSSSQEDYLQSRLKSAGMADVLDKLQGHEMWGGGMIDCVGGVWPATFEECVKWARLKYEDYVVSRTVQLTHLYPRDATTQAGSPFWTAPKRFPEPVMFDADDEMCMQFVVAASNLRAKVFDVSTPATNRDPAYFKDVLAEVEVPVFTPRSDVTIETEETKAESSDEQQEQLSDNDDTVQQILAKLPDPQTLRGACHKMVAEEFEKDDDTNFHMDFIRALANLRARNHSIGEVDKLEAKLKAGRIIPAIATTTAMVTGFACLELCKLVNRKPVSDHRNTFSNLAVCFFVASEPLGPATIRSRTDKTKPDPINHPDYEEEEEIRAYPEGHTIWDHLHVQNDCDFTLGELMEQFPSPEANLKVVSVGVVKSGKILYHASLPHTKKRLGEKMTKLVSAVGELDVQALKDVQLAMTFADATDADKSVETPLVIYNLFP